MYFPVSTVTVGFPRINSLGFAWALNWSLRWVLGFENNGKLSWRFGSRRVGMNGDGFGKWREFEIEIEIE